MLEIIIANFKNILYTVIGIIFLIFIAWSFSNYQQKIKLRQENNVLIQTKQAQENIINIHDITRKIDENLQNEVEIEIQKTKKINSKNKEDFLRKSGCIFRNFGNKNYECN